MNESKKNNIMRKTVIGLLLISIGAVLGGVVSVFAFIYVTGGTATPSQPISAPTLALEVVNTSQPPPTEVDIIVDITESAVEIAAVVASPTLKPEPTSVPTDPPTVEPTPEPTEEPTAQPTLEPTHTPEPQLPPQLYRINSDRSEVRFSVYETFPEGTAIGRTNQIAGDIILDFNNPANSQLGTVRINLRSLVTDDPKRDASIRCCVLLTAQDAYEFGEFVPTNLANLPSMVQVGGQYNFSVSGNLTVRGVTQPVTFEVGVLVNSLNEISGTAKTIANRSVFNILDNHETGLDHHGVAEEVTLEFDFVANAVSE